MFDADRRTLLAVLLLLRNIGDLYVLCPDRTLPVILCDCGQVAIALIGEDEIALCLTHYADVLELATARIGDGRFRPLENVTTGGVL